MTKEQIIALMDAEVITNVVSVDKLVGLSTEELIKQGYLTYTENDNWGDILGVSPVEEVTEPVVEEVTEPVVEEVTEPVVEEVTEPVVEEATEPEIVVDEGEDEE